MKVRLYWSLILGLFIMAACMDTEIPMEEEVIIPMETMAMDTVNTNPMPLDSMEVDSSGIDTIDNQLAKITEVTISGTANNYTFNVTISSLDTGCDQYADWWEVITKEGELLYRRILTHSHVDEQPFARSGGPINIADTSEVIVRAHMNNLNYGNQIFQGAVNSGLRLDSLNADFAIELATTEPLPNGCDF